MERIELTLKNEENLNALKRKLGIGKVQMYALGDKECHVTTNMDKIVKVAQEFYKNLYSSWDSRNNNGRGSSPDEFEIPTETVEEQKKSFRNNAKDETRGEDRVTRHLLKHISRSF